jgi:hypothetical protein
VRKPKNSWRMLSEEQIKRTFELLKIPLERMNEESPIELPCPFEHRHTKKTRETDCILYFHDGPNLACYHESCSEELREFSQMLRFFVTGTTRGDCDSASLLAPRCPPNRALAEEVSIDRPSLLHKFAGKLRSPTPTGMSSIGFLQRRFYPSDILWIGNEFQSGDKFKDHFRTLEEWEKKPPLPQWDFTVAATFWPGSEHRDNRSVAQRRYLILEGDTFGGADIPVEEQFAMIAWARETFDLSLRALLYSGRISYHAWFDWPGETWLQAHKLALEEMGFDGKTMRKSQPVRLGGAIRTLKDKTHKRQEIFLCQ